MMLENVYSYWQQQHSLVCCMIYFCTYRADLDSDSASYVSSEGNGYNISDSDLEVNFLFDSGAIVSEV